MSLLKGVIDMHIHGSPSAATRKNTPDLMRIMGKLGYRAFVLKDHYYPTAGVCSILNQWLREETGVTACSSIVLNNSVGGLNLYAVDAAVNMGTKVVCFPTVSAKCHMEAMAAFSFPGAGKGMEISEKNKPISVLGDNGELNKETIAIIEYIAKRPEICLWTGHLSTEEIDKVAECAFYKGVKKLYANHPYWLSGASVDHIREWAEQGMYIELNMFVQEKDCIMSVDPNIILEIIRTFPLNKLVLCTDFGQINKPLPTEGMISYIEYLENNGVTEEQISVMTKEVPAYLLGLDGD